MYLSTIEWKGVVYVGEEILDIWSDSWMRHNFKSKKKSCRSTKKYIVKRESRSVTKEDDYR